jgi:hypothetical protein
VLARVEAAAAAAAVAEAREKGVQVGLHIHALPTQVTCWQGQDACMEGGRNSISASSDHVLHMLVYSGLQLQPGITELRSMCTGRRQWYSLIGMLSACSLATALPHHCSCLHTTPTFHILLLPAPAIVAGPATIVCPFVPMNAKLLTLPNSRPSDMLLLPVEAQGKLWRGTCTPKLLACDPARAECR